MKNKLFLLTASLAFLFIATTSFAEARHCRRSTSFGVNFGTVAVQQQPCYVVERYPVYQVPVYQAPVVMQPAPQCVYQQPAPQCACEQRVVAVPVRPVYYQETVYVRRPVVQVMPTIGLGFGWSWFR